MNRPNPNVLAILNVLGIVANVVQIGSSTDVAWKLVAMFFLIIVFGIAVRYREDMRYAFDPTSRLEGQQNIDRIFAKMVGDATTLLYLGALNTTTAERLMDRYNKKKENEKIKIDIYNTDPGFYTKASNGTVLDRLVKLDVSTKDFNHFFCFHPQAIDLLRTKNGHRTRTLMGIANPAGSSQAILVNKNIDFYSGESLAKEACPINIVHQAFNVEAVSGQFRRFVIGLRDGWYQPVFPPTDDGSVRAVWRKAILRWFNLTATSICSGAGSGSTVLITWRLVRHSPDDAEEFTSWLDMLMQTTNIEVKRFLLIDYPQYKRDHAYKADVDKVIQDYFAPSQAFNNRYTVRKLDSTLLKDTALNRDYALMKINGETYAQDSIRDTEANVEVLRTFFTQNIETVDHFVERFTKLTNEIPHAEIKQL